MCVIDLEDEDMEYLEFIQDDMSFWIKFMDANRDNDFLREQSREIIIWCEDAIKEVKRMIYEGRERSY